MGAKPCRSKTRAPRFSKSQPFPILLKGSVILPAISVTADTGDAFPTFCKVTITAFTTGAADPTGLSVNGANADATLLESTIDVTGSGSGNGNAVGISASSSLTVSDTSITVTGGNMENIGVDVGSSGSATLKDSDIRTPDSSNFNGAPLKCAGCSVEVRNCVFEGADPDDAASVINSSDGIVKAATSQFIGFRNASGFDTCSTFIHCYDQDNDPITDGDEGGCGGS